MKKDFLLLGIVGFTTASAQQKELFGINKHLKKKNAEKSTATPKTKLGFSRTSSSRLKLIKKSTNHSFALPNSDKVYSSPTYNMPHCSS